jgi:RNA polymerase sigma-70 factor, ECF subfamily
MKEKLLKDIYSKLFIKYRNENCMGSFTKLYIDSSVKLKPFLDKNIKDIDVSSDIFHDAWSKLLKKPELFKEESGEFFAYFHRIISNDVIKYKTKNTNLNFTDFDEEVHYLKDYKKDDFNLLMSKKELACVITELSVAHQEVILLHYYYDVTLAQTSRMLGININTIKSRIVKARVLLKSLLETKGIFLK